MESEDLVGMDRLARSFARQIARMQSPCMIAVHGAPGSAKRDFLKSLSGLVTDPRALGLTPGRELYPETLGVTCRFDTDSVNVAADPANADTARKLAAILRSVV